METREFNNNDHNPDITPTICEFFHVKKKGNRSAHESVSWWEVNIKFFLVTMAVGVVLRKVSTSWGIRNLSKVNNFINVFKRVEQDIV